MKYTIKDIADACNVSKTTVSRYLNKSGYVSKEVEEKLRIKIEEFNYVPSATARSLSTRRSNVVGVITPEANNPFFAQVFKGLSEIADSKGLSIIYFNTDNNIDKELKAIQTLRSYEISGLIITPSSDGAKDSEYVGGLEKAVNELNVPVVLFDRELSINNWYGVYSDNENGAYKGTQLLIEKGHQCISTITGDMGLQLGRLRHSGFEKAIQDNKWCQVDSIIEYGDFTTDTAYEKTLKILNMKHPPTAIFSPNNMSTIGVLKGVFEKQLKIPDDIALVAYDDIEILNDLSIPITVLKRNAIQMGRISMNLLYELVSNTDMNKEYIKMAGKDKKIIVESELVIRHSESLVL